MTLPLGRIDGCPVGLSVIGAPGNDTQLLALAKTLA
jgi:amidase